MTYLQILILAIVQGLCELLPVSSSAHVVVAEKLMGLNPSSPAMTLLLVMLHTGTMFAVIVYFWRGWQKDYFSSKAAFVPFAKAVVVATILTGAVGEPLILFIEKVLMHPAGPAEAQKAEIEQLFSNLELVGAALAAVGVFIVVAGLREKRNERTREVSLKDAAVIGAVQGLCLPFRGFSRSGSTISAGMLLGLPKRKLEEFSFALAVVITPPVIAREVLRLKKALALAGEKSSALHFAPGLVGMVLSFLAGLLALKWLSRWLEGGQWWLFGIYCLVASGAVFALHYVWGY